MIYIEKNTAQNKLNLTLSNDTITTGLTSNYTLYLKSGQHITPYLFSMTDISSYPHRYNLFIVSGSTFSAATIGYYDYEVKNSDVYTGTTLEKGKCILTGNTSNTIYTNNTNTNTTYIDNRD